MIFLRTMFLGLLLAGGLVLSPGEIRSDGDMREPTVAYIVRHAEREDKTEDSPLSTMGSERAQVLKWMLRDVPLDIIYHTNKLRTKSTVEPLARARGIKPLEWGNAAELAPIIKHRWRGKTLLVCGHSNTIPSLLEELGVGIDEDLLEGFDNLFILSLTIDSSDGTTSASLQRLHYPGRR